MFKAKNLLCVSADAKTVKGLKHGVLTGILYLAPYNLSGFQVCPKASPECSALCLFTAGRGIYANIQKSRIDKTRWFFEERHTFMETLVANIERLIRKAKAMRMTPAVRLNGTSDIAWEKIACVRNGRIYPSVIEAFPTIQFYDYTKILGRTKALGLQNYHLTFSLSENNDTDAAKALTQGYNVAVVLNTRRTEAKPATWGGYPVIDGDKTDARFTDPKGGHIVALHAKGKARKEPSGFVRAKDGGFVPRSVRKAA